MTETGGEDELPDKYKMAAVRLILTGRETVKKHLGLEVPKYERLRNTIVNWAVYRQLGKERKGDSMHMR